MPKIQMGSKETKAATYDIKRLSGKTGEKYRVAFLGYPIEGGEFNTGVKPSFWCEHTTYVEGEGGGCFILPTEEHREVCEDVQQKHQDRATIPVLVVPERKGKVDRELLTDGAFRLGIFNLTKNRFEALCKVENEEGGLSGKDFVVEMGAMGAISFKPCDEDSLAILKKEAPDYYEVMVSKFPEFDNECKNMLGRPITAGRLKALLETPDVPDTAAETTEKDVKSRLKGQGKRGK